MQGCRIQSVLVFVVCLSIVLTSTSGFNTNTYTNAITLSPNYTLHWIVEPPYFQVALEVKTLGWVGFGIGESTSGSMPGSDSVTGYVHTDGTVEFYDRYTEVFAQPIVDECQDWELVGGYKNDTSTVIEVRRLLDTGDTQDRVVGPGPTRIVWAHGADADTTIQYHEDRRGVNAIEFIPSIFPRPALPSNALNSTFTFPNITIPNTFTNYLCGSFLLPDPSTRSQIIQIDPVIDPNNTDLAHHMLIYICNNPNSTWSTFSGSNLGTQCSSTSFSSDCPQILTAWAVGVGPLVFPAEAGFHLGTAGGGTPGAQYVLVQMHYTNPKLTAGRTDNSGFRIHYITDNLRQNDAGVLVLGDALVRQPDIPAGEAAYEVEITCPNQCTSTWPYTLNVFADAVHMHFLGSKMWTTQWRDGGDTFIRETNGAEYYSYNLQQTTTVNYTIQPGDDLNTHCVYNSEGQSESTKFGAASTQEMCMEFLFYYPVLPGITYCGYLAEQLTSCGDPSHASSSFLLVSNPSRRDPSNLVRVGETFGNPCSSKVGSVGSGPGFTSTAGSSAGVKIYSWVDRAVYYLY